MRGQHRPEFEIGLIAQHQPVIGVKQHEAIGQALDRVAQARARRVRIAVGQREVGIGAVEAGQRRFQRGGALAHHLFERDRRLEHRKGAAVDVG